MKTVLIAFSDKVLNKYQLKSKFAHSCVVTPSLNDLYTNLWQYKQAVILLEYIPIIPITNNSDELLTKDMNLDILLFKFLKLLKYKKILVTIEKIQKISNENQAQVEIAKLINFFFNDLDRQQTYERNIFGLENPKVQVIKNLKIEEINQFFHQDQFIEKNKIFETECLIISNQGPIHKVQILQGNLYKGQLLESNEKQVWVKTVELNDKGFVFVSFEGDIVVKGLLFCPHNKPDIIKEIEVEAQLCLFDYYQLKDTFRKMGKITLMRYNEKFAIENTNANPIIFIGLRNEQGEYHRVGEKTFNMVKLEISIEDANFLNIQSESPMLFFQNESNNIQFIGRISKILSSTKRNVDKVYCFPLCTFQECENMKVGEKDLRYLCRICKQKTSFMIPNECGHLRYCDECITNCVDAGECFYCNLKITGGIRINKIVVDRQIYKKVKEENIISQKFSSEILKDTEIPAFLKIIYVATKIEGIQNFYSIFCQLCNKNIIENYTRCSGGHITLICKECQPKCTTNNCQNNPSESRMIVYEYFDDYYN